MSYRLQELASWVSYSSLKRIVGQSNDIRHWKQLATDVLRLGWHFISPASNSLQAHQVIKLRNEVSHCTLFHNGQPWQCESVKYFMILRHNWIVCPQLTYQQLVASVLILCQPFIINRAVPLASNV